MQPNDQQKHNHGSLDDYIEAGKAASPKEGEYTAAKHRLLEKIHSTEKESLMKTLINKTILSRGYFWPKAIGTTAVIILIAVLMIPGNNNGKVYAQVVSQLQQAETIQFLASWFVGDQETPTKMNMAYRYPGKKRMEFAQQENTIVQILDDNTKKGLILYPGMKQYLNIDIGEIPSQERERVELISAVLDTIGTLPADVELDGKSMSIDGRKVQVFELEQCTLGIDLKENELVFLEKNLGGSKMIMTDFRLDPVDVSDQDFSLTPPDDYTSMSEKAISYDFTEAPSIEDLIRYLKMASTMTQKKMFPPSLNPMDILTLQKEGKITGEGMEDPDAQAIFGQTCQRAVMFTMTLKKENGLKYAGDGVAQNQKDTPIVWWKKTGEDVYQVIMADLTVKEMSEEQLPE